MQNASDNIKSYRKIMSGITNTQLSDEEVVEQGQRVVEFFSILIDIDKRIMKEKATLSWPEQIYTIIFSLISNR